jgi:hypothetical protein
MTARRAVEKTKFSYRPEVEILEDRITPRGGTGITLALTETGQLTAIAGTAYSPVAQFSANTSVTWSESGLLDGMAFSGSGTSATLSGTAITAGSYNFSVTISSGKTKTSHNYTLTVTPGKLSQLVINAPSSATAASPFSITISAEDSEGNVVTSASGPVTLTCCDGQTVSPSSVTLSGGKVTTNVMLNHANYVTLTASGLGVNGASGGINVTATGADWFAINMPDATLQNLARSDYTRDGSIGYSDMLGLLNQAIAEGTVSSATFSSLQSLVSSSGAFLFNASEANVQNLAYKLIDGDSSNAYYQGTIPLGNLAVGSSSTQLLELTQKWFLGEDHPIIDTQYWGTSGYAMSASRALYGSSGAPQYTDVYQGEEGDCWLIASFCTAANSTNTAKGQTAIIGQFIDEGAIGLNGAEVWSVRFYHNGVAQYVTVDNYFPVNGSVFMYANFYQSISNSSESLWVALDEKAYAQLCGSGWNSRPSTNSYASLNGGNASTALPLITGSTTTNSGAFGSESAFISAIQGGTLLTMASWSTADGYVASHDYAVISVSGSGSSAVFVLYNPWGSSQPGTTYWSTLTASGAFSLDGNTVVSSISSIPDALVSGYLADFSQLDAPARIPAMTSNVAASSYLADSTATDQVQGNSTNAERSAAIAWDAASTHHLKYPAQPGADNDLQDAVQWINLGV